MGEEKDYPCNSGKNENPEKISRGGEMKLRKTYKAEIYSMVNMIPGDPQGSPDESFSVLFIGELNG